MPRHAMKGGEDSGGSAAHACAFVEMQSTDVGEDA
jgi:hypothetical protein